jgi:hypothetical protein
MAVTIELPTGERATIHGYYWTGDDELTVRLLNRRLDPDGPSPADGDYDRSMAYRMAAEYMGQVVAADPVKPGVKGRIY